MVGGGMRFDFSVIAPIPTLALPLSPKGISCGAKGRELGPSPFTPLRVGFAQGEVRWGSAKPALGAWG
jgi:hypothetical protein